VFHEASKVTMVALGTWFVTVLFGVNLLLRGKAYRLFLYAVTGRAPAGARAPIGRAALMGLHLVCATTGFAAWAAYAASDREGFAYLALSLLAVVALLGLGVVDRWRNGYGRHVRPVGHRFPVWSAAVHVVVAAATVILVALITLLNVGG
jgi:hypothetical protein